MNRHLRTTLPSVKTEKTSPPLTNPLKVKENHDKHAKNLRRIKEGQSVRIREGKSWSIKGKVTGRAEQPRSYVVKTENNSTVRGDRRDLLSTPEQFKLSSLPDYEIELPSEATPQIVQPAPRLSRTTLCTCK